MIDSPLQPALDALEDLMKLIAVTGRKLDMPYVESDSSVLGAMQRDALRPGHGERTIADGTNLRRALAWATSPSAARGGARPTEHHGDPGDNR